MHNVEVVEVKELSDGEIAVCLRCCGDARSDSWHTLSNLHNHDQAAVTEWIQNRKAHVADRHQAKQRAQEILSAFQSAIPDRQR